MNTQAILTIAIPTFNRASYLAQTLDQLSKDVIKQISNKIEIIVSDNASPDDTEKIVHTAVEKGLPIRYIKNIINIGSDANIAQCFNLARGNYVLILGDDDLFIDGGLSDLLNQLSDKQYGVVCVKPYGFDHDFRREYPGTAGNNQLYDNVGAFLADIGPLMTLISGCVINRNLLSDVDANDYCGENLVQVHLVVQAAIKAKQNLFMNHYMMACKRNNSGGYDFSKVFVQNVGNILDSYIGRGLQNNDISNIERKFMLGFFPFYLMKQRFYRQGNPAESYKIYAQRYKHHYLFYLWLYPILKAPRWFAISWGALTTLIGRVLYGDFNRGIAFALNKIKSLLRRDH